jgi:hypothetical protein
MYSQPARNLLGMLFGAGKFVRFATILELQCLKFVVAKFDRVRQPFLDKHRTGLRRLPARLVPVSRVVVIRECHGSVC